MPASLGNAVHNSVEDICNLDLSGRDSDESGWMTPTAKAILDRHWKIEKSLFSLHLGIRGGKRNS